MSKVLTFIAGLLLAIIAKAQPVAGDSATSKRERDYLFRHELTHARVLSAWAATNLVVGGTAMFFSQGEAHQFHHMNAAWGSINLLVGGSMWYKVRHPKLPFSSQSVAQKSTQFKRLLLINVGLDLAYLATGLLLHQQASGENQAVFHGFGKSIMLQGGALLTLDVTSLLLLTSHQKRFRNHLLH
ncbi:hypothetical protein GCM10028803_08640 [Larkinella knui]|uniref:Uncharacterized protein n=1 Tax=Larkinella knui TaxID=2025310 RepID=A0A3P1CK90_9BACT|nr:hypothetical protein [Larkinella knui]RRB13476.1 hypothetical protein EHT87_14480 [Larkinella knui]